MFGILMKGVCLVFKLLELLEPDGPIVRTDLQNSLRQGAVRCGWLESYQWTTTSLHIFVFTYTSNGQKDSSLAACGFVSTRLQKVHLARLVAGRSKKKRLNFIINFAQAERVLRLVASLGHGFGLLLSSLPLSQKPNVCRSREFMCVRVKSSVGYSMSFALHSTVWSHRSHIFGSSWQNKRAFSKQVQMFN
ncbi:uncharacterized protein LOC133843516 [Drosophila sulfurigaster albostrigata]|uniref:uncharacterized protein LOC133843516 n=1 Tax=Drosophila sulfurigaster albostrigata TaxID=89887 RepID=UPI002D219F6C|nr:uncharacterized protein LOC133843516 [Drosophila sulfurigaster albostrigata]